MHESVWLVNAVPRHLLELLDTANYSYSALSLPYFAAALVIAVTAALVVYWERGSRIGYFFAGWTLLACTWILARGLLRMLPDPELVVVLSRAFYALLCLALPLVHHFVLLLLRREKERLGFIRFNWILGITLSLASVSTPWMISGWHDYPWGLEPRHGLLGFGFLLWIAVLIVATSLELYRAIHRTLPQSKERRRLSSFAVGQVVLYLAIIDFLAATGVAVYPLSFIPVVLFTAITAYTTWRHGLTEVTAQLAANEIAAMTRGALLILDADGVVQVVNDRCESLLGMNRANTVGKSAGTLLGDAFSSENLALLAHTEGHDHEKGLLYVHPATRQPHDLTLSVTTVRDAHGREVAYVCVLRDVTEQMRRERERLNEGLKDTLTGLPTRSLFLGLLEAAVQRRRESPDYAYAVLFVGLDRMRVINEDLGYQAGDMVLTEVTARLRKAIRAQDVVARLGGDEFGVLIRGYTGMPQLQLAVERLTDAIHAPLRQSDEDLYLAASIGVAGSDQQHATGAELLRHASVAMYQAKERGGNSVCHYAATGGQEQRTRLEADLRRAIVGDEFRAHYQPVVDLQEQRVVGFEALVRWQHPQRGLLNPAEFLDYTERIGLVGALDRIMLELVCADLREFQRVAGDTSLRVSINVCEEELLDIYMVQRLEEQCLQNGLSASALTIEVLERVAQVEPARETLLRLRALGVSLAIDDFGTGYSALSRLHQMPVSILKIDRNFVRAMSTGEGGEKIIGGILALAKNLGLEVIAEGCSLAEEVRRLRQLGCRYVQGFYFSKGVPFEAALEMLRNPQPLADKFAAVEALLPTAAALSVQPPARALQ